MATLDNFFYSYDTSAVYVGDLGMGLINPDGIVFIKDTGQIIAKGHVYAGFTFPIRYQYSITYTNGNLEAYVTNAAQSDADEIWIGRTTAVSPTNAVFNLYIGYAWLNAIIERMKADGTRYKQVRIKVLHFSSKEISAGFYYSVNGGVASMTLQNNGWYVGTDTTNRIYFRTPWSCGNSQRKALQGVEFEAVIDFWCGTSSTSYTNVVARILSD